MATDWKHGDLTTPEDLDPLAGTPYRAVQRIGHGAMGEVYAARHSQNDQEVAVKLLHSELVSEPKTVERLRVEARALGALRHPNIVQVLGWGETTDGRPYLVLERLHGKTLAEELRSKGRPPLLQALLDIQQVLNALHAAHAVSLVHRDIKPSNVFAHRDPNGARIMKLLDFSIVKVLDTPSNVPHRIETSMNTTLGVALGTPRFMSPEQVSAQPIDLRSDLYSVGLVLYILVAGEGPFDDLIRGGDVVAAHLRRLPKPPSQLVAEPIPRELDEVVLKALQKLPEDRFQSAAEFAEGLASIAEALGKPAGWLETTAVDHFEGSEFESLRFATTQPEVGEGPRADLHTWQPTLPLGNTNSAKSPPNLQPRQEPKNPLDSPGRLAPTRLILLFFLVLVLCVGVVLMLFD